jgi:hypothetical protein
MSGKKLDAGSDKGSGVSSFSMFCEVLSYRAVSIRVIGQGSSPRRCFGKLRLARLGSKKSRTKS